MVIGVGVAQVMVGVVGLLGFVVVVVVAFTPVGNDSVSADVLTAVVDVVLGGGGTVGGTVVVVEGATSPRLPGFFTDVVVVAEATEGCDGEVGPPPRYRKITAPVTTITSATAMISHRVHWPNLPCRSACFATLLLFACCKGD